MNRHADLIQRVALGGNRRQMARLARLGIKWPAPKGRRSDGLRKATARCALDRLGAAASHDLLACGLIDESYFKNTQGDEFDPLCALLMQPVCPQRVLLALETTDPGQGPECTHRLGVVGVRLVQAAGRMLADYTADAYADRVAWLGLVDQLIERGMAREARLWYAPVGLLGVCTDTGMARGLLERGFLANGPEGEGLLPPLSLCQDAGVARTLIRAGADCLVPAVNFVDDPVGMLGEIEHEENRVLMRWCRLDTGVARELLEASRMERFTDQNIEDVIVCLHDNSPIDDDEIAETSALFDVLCLGVGMERMETLMGPEGGHLRRAVMLNPGMAQGYLRARAQACGASMSLRTADACQDQQAVGRF